MVWSKGAFSHLPSLLRHVLDVPTSIPREILKERPDTMSEAEVTERHCCLSDDDHIHASRARPNCKKQEIGRHVIKKKYTNKNGGVGFKILLLSWGVIREITKFTLKIPRTKRLKSLFIFLTKSTKLTLLLFQPKAMKYC